MDGYKTYIAGIALIVLGIAGGALGFAMPGSEHAMDPNTAVDVIIKGLEVIGIGFGLIGLRHAVTKMRR